MPLTIGLDLVAIATVAETLSAPLAERYLRRVYTEAEVASCRRGGRVDPARLATRFAAKEAVLKALAILSDELSLREIEVSGETADRVQVELRGRAATLADEAGLRALAVSITRDRDLAAAFAVAEYS